MRFPKISMDSTRLLKRAIAFLFIFGLGVAAATAFSLPPKYRTISVEGGGDGSSELGPAGPSANGTAAAGEGGPLGKTGSAGSTTKKSITSLNYKCEAGRNGGPTDKGVTGSSVTVAANTVQDGPGASFLGEAIIGLQSVIDEANVKGICGRKILLDPRNDSWDRQRGLTYIENYIHSGVFALAVNPSSEGLDQAVINGTIDRAGIPVIGSDGMLISQYRYVKSGNDLAKWVWPVAASTVSTMHIVVQHALEYRPEGCNPPNTACMPKTFGIVYDKQYKFGVEGADAFEGAIERIRAGGRSDVRLVKKVGIEPARPSYTEDANRFNEACGGDPAQCDLVALLLDPTTAITWIKSAGTFGKILTAGPQTLFNAAFGEQCVRERTVLRKRCDLWVWTGYNPPLDSLARLSDVSKYVQDLKSRNSNADEFNSFTQGAYLGAKVFVKALEQVGPNLTRANLRVALDNMTYTSDLTNELVWKSGNHFANTAMQSFIINHTPDNNFAKWQAANTGWIKDRWVGQL